MSSPTHSPAPGDHALQRHGIDGYHRQLTEALAHLEATATGTASPDRVRPGSAADIAAAARELATAVHPLIQHLPDITAALEDAAAWREDDGGWCRDCARTRTPDRRRPDHTHDQTRAAAYRAALTALTTARPPPRR